jgi:hypothetical protein
MVTNLESQLATVKGLARDLRLEVEKYERMLLDLKDEKVEAKSTAETPYTYTYPELADLCRLEILRREALAWVRDLNAIGHGHSST